MKTSNILLIGLLAVMLLFGFTSNLVLKTEFEKINKNDIFAGYRKEPLKPFKYISLGGNAFGYAQIQPGKNFEIRTTASPEILEWKIESDTLKVNYKRKRNDEGYNPPSPFWGAPVIYILAPEISAINSKDVISKVSGWNSKNLSLHQNGRLMLLTNSKIDLLTVRIESQGHFEIDSRNTVNSAKVQVMDSSDFITENVFKLFSMEVDSAAHAKLPGKLLKNTSGI